MSPLLNLCNVNVSPAVGHPPSNSIMSILLTWHRECLGTPVMSYFDVHIGIYLWWFSIYCYIIYYIASLAYKVKYTNINIINIIQ